MINLRDQTRRMELPNFADSRSLLVPIFRQGQLIYELPTLEEIRHHRMVELHHISDGIKRFDNRDEYRVGLEKSLYVQRENLILEHRGGSDWEVEAA